MKKTAKKVNVKDLAKKEVKAMLENVLKDKYSVSEGKLYGMTKDTIVLHGENCDIQVKIITPKTGVIRYEEVTED